jgi:hypothetical protein
LEQDQLNREYVPLARKNFVRALLFFFCAVCLAHVARAQSGNYFLSHFAPGQSQLNSETFDIVQDDRGLFFIATQRGVVVYDGLSWELIRTHGAAYALEFGPSGNLFVAGSQGFGEIITNARGQYEYVPLYEQPDAEFAFQIIRQGERVYFINDKHVFVYAAGQVTRPVSSATGNWVSLTELFGQVFAGTEEDKLFTLSGATVKPSRLFPDSTTVIFTERYENTYVVGTSDSRLYLCDERMTPREIRLADADYVSAGVMVNATWVNNTLVAIATLRGGVVFINPATGATEEIVNYATGLPDNEVYAIVRDKNHNIWVAHSYGYTRIAPFLPIRSFRYFQGLQGNLLCALRHNQQVYVGTSLGLFKLERMEHYEEIEYYVNIPVTRKQPEKQKVTDPATEKQQTRGGLFNFLRKKKRTSEEQPVAQQPQRQAAKTTYRKEKRTRKILRATHYAYTKVPGIDTKVTQLIPWNNKLIASGLSGAYEVTGEGAVTITEEPVRYALASATDKSLLLSTYDDKLMRMVYQKNGWVESATHAFSDPINFMFEQPGVTRWLCGLDNVYRMPYDTSGHVSELAVSNPEFSGMVGIRWNEGVLVASSAGFYFIQSAGAQFQRIDSLPRPAVYFASNNAIWFRDEHSWHAVGHAQPLNVRLLNLFQEVRYVSQDAATGNLWIITGSNELLQFNPAKALLYETRYPLLLKSIERDTVVLAQKETLRLEQENSAIRITVVKPDYIGVSAVEYRYVIHGLHEQWSDWSVSNHTLDFPYLPPGEYELQVQAKDIFGRVTDMQPLSFKVLPPYWKRPWFYALEFGVFTLLVLASFRLSNRYRLISRVLSLLSIIILIEFIQTVAGSTFSIEGGPVVEFAVQVGIAFLILPVEGFLRNFLLRTIDKRSEYKLPEGQQ